MFLCYRPQIFSPACIKIVNKIYIVNNAQINEICSRCRRSRQVRRARRTERRVSDTLILDSMPYIYLGPKIKISAFLPPLLFLLFCTGAPVLSAAVSVIIHEAAHLAAGAFFRLKPAAVTVSPLGADIKYSGVIPYKTEIPLALSGPFLSVVFAFAVRPFSRECFSVSLIYGLLNLLPVPCFDGGRALCAAVYGRFSYNTADAVCGAVNTVFLILLYLFSVFVLFYTSFNASLLLICACIFVRSYVKMTSFS